MRTQSNEWKELPSVETINQLALQILRAAKELNEARRKGFLYDALEMRKNKLGKLEQE